MISHIKIMTYCIIIIYICTDCATQKGLYCLITGKSADMGDGSKQRYTLQFGNATMTRERVYCKCISGERSKIMSS